MNMSKLGDGRNEAEWRKAFPILFNVAFATLRWKLGLSFDDAEDVAQESVAEIINSKFKFKFADKTFNDLKRFTGVVAYNKGVDFTVCELTKRGSGGVLSLNEKIGEKGITRLELVASRLENFDYYKLFDYVSAVDDCRNETLNEKEKNFIHSYYIFGDCHREIAKKNNLPNERVLG